MFPEIRVVIAHKNTGSGKDKDKNHQGDECPAGKI